MTEAQLQEVRVLFGALFDRINDVDARLALYMPYQHEIEDEVDTFIDSTLGGWWGHD